MKTYTPISRDTVRNLVLRHTNVIGNDSRSFAVRINNITDYYTKVGRLKGWSVKETARQIIGRALQT